MKVFDNEWVFGPFEGHATFFTKRMFGGLAAYLFDRQMLVLVEPTKTGRWKWHGALIAGLITNASRRFAPSSPR